MELCFQGESLLLCIMCINILILPKHFIRTFSSYRSVCWHASQFSSSRSISLDKPHSSVHLALSLQPNLTVLFILLCLSSQASQFSSSRSFSLARPHSSLPLVLSLQPGLTVRDTMKLSFICHNNATLFHSPDRHLISPPQLSS